MSDPCKRTWYLRRVDLFRDVSDAEVEALARVLRGQTYRGGELIVGPENSAERVYIIIEGTVRLFQRGPDGREVTAALIGRGRLFGISALFGPSPSDGLLAEAVTDVRVCAAEAEDFLRLASEHHQLMLKLAAQVTERLLQVEEQLERFAAAGARARLAAVLGRLAEEAGEAVAGGGRRLPAGLRQADLARQIGASRETVSRQLAGLEADRHIRREGRRIVVSDPVRLAETFGLLEGGRQG